MTDENANYPEFLAVVNDEEQYSVRFVDRDLPPGVAGRGHA